VTELLRFAESRLVLIEGECLALVGGAARELALSLVGLRPTARNVASLGIVDLARVPVAERRFAYVGAQDGLSAHKTVVANVAAPLRPPAGFIAQALELVGLIGRDEQPVASLSRYDRQRVALARALAGRPRLLVLDDPVAELAPSGQSLFRRLLQKIHQARRELSLLLVTERCLDALMLADRIAVLEGSRVLQVGTPRELYERPNSDVVAMALGEVNLLPGRVVACDDEVAVVALDGTGAEVEAMAPEGCGVGMQGQVAIRPERVAITSGLMAEAGDHALRAKFLDEAFLGDTVLLRFGLDDGTVVLVKRPSAAPLGGMVPGRLVALAWQPAAARILISGLE